MIQKYSEERKGERRNRNGHAHDKLRNFIYNYWLRYYKDRPDMDRRKHPDRRAQAIRTNF